MRITELGGVSLFARDLDASVALYRDLLGQEVAPAGT